MRHAPGYKRRSFKGSRVPAAYWKQDESVIPVGRLQEFWEHNRTQFTHKWNRDFNARLVSDYNALAERHAPGSPEYAQARKELFDAIIKIEDWPFWDYVPQREFRAGKLVNAFFTDEVPEYFMYRRGELEMTARQGAAKPGGKKPGLLGLDLTRDAAGDGGAAKARARRGKPEMQIEGQVSLAEIAPVSAKSGRPAWHDFNSDPPETRFGQMGLAKIIAGIDRQLSDRGGFTYRVIGTAGVVQALGNFKYDPKGRNFDRLADPVLKSVDRLGLDLGDGMRNFEDLKRLVKAEGSEGFKKILAEIDRAGGPMCDHARLAGLDYVQARSLISDRLLENAEDTRYNHEYRDTDGRTAQREGFCRVVENYFIEREGSGLGRLFGPDSEFYQGEDVIGNKPDDIAMDFEALSVMYSHGCVLPEGERTDRVFDIMSHYASQVLTERNDPAHIKHWLEQGDAGAIQVISDRVTEAARSRASDRQAFESSRRFVRELTLGTINRDEAAHAEKLKNMPRKSDQVARDVIRQDEGYNYDGQPGEHQAPDWK